MRKNSSGNIFAMLFGALALVGLLGVAGMNLLLGPLSTASSVTHYNTAQNDLLVNARILIMNTSVRGQMGDEDGDGYAEPAPFIPVGQNGCNIVLPENGLGGCLPEDVGATMIDPWGTQYAYCVWDHGSITDSVNRIAGEDNTAAAVIALISAGPNKRFETPCAAYDGDPATNDNVIDVNGVGDDIVRVYSYVMAQTASDGLWSLKENTPNTAAIDKNIEIDGAFRMGFAGENPGQVGSQSCSAGEHIGRMRFNETENTIDVCNYIENSYLWTPMSGGAIGKVVDGDDIALLPPEEPQEPEDDPCETGLVGTACSDGAIYAGSVGGVRFYAAPSDESGTMTWNNGSSNWIVTNATSLTDGLANTNTLVGLTDAAAPYAAAVACRARGANWYLPSKDELNVMYSNRTAIGGFNTGGTYYWSSSEYNGNDARVQRLSDGSQTYGNKLNIFLVRCVRR